ncbi:MAG: class I SAM-dependent methyltransferase [Leptonema sp. (in: Bacteria)]|nr:class I SAM-dependent methyltransferase [Leptonema sp. (in: bacteria)]
MNRICSHTGQPLQLLTEADRFAISNEGIIYSLDAHTIDYEDDYFFTDYEKQYGKSYQKDESNLRRLAKNRLQWLAKSIQNSPTYKSKPLQLLEIGSATGFFIDEANSAGYDSVGIEVSSWACRQAKQLGANVIQSSFLDLTIEAESKLIEYSFDVIAAFYVIEHFADQNKIFKQIERLLRPGGYFIFALPSTQGPLFQCNLQTWVATHPTDHYVDYSPQSLKQILPIYNMKSVCFRPASYHQERSCGILKRLPNFLYKAYSDSTGYGDTIECIAKKIN